MYGVFYHSVLLHLLYDIELMWRKTIKHAVSMFYTLIKQGLLTNESAHRVFTHKWPGYAGSFTSNSTSLQKFIAHLMKIPKYRIHVKDLISNRFGNASEKKQGQSTVKRINLIALSNISKDITILHRGRVSSNYDRGVTLNCSFSFSSHMRASTCCAHLDTLLCYTR